MFYSFTFLVLFKESEECGINLVGDITEGFAIWFKLQSVAIDDDEFTLVVFYLVFISVVETG